MRISTNMIFERGTTQMQNRSAEMVKLQEQIATGRRVVSPSDDPIAAASALVVSQAKAVNAQYENNRGEAKSALATVDSVLAGVGELLSYVKEKIIQSGNGALSQADRSSIATDLRARFDSLMGMANTQDATGGFLFAGFQTDTRPFVGDSASGVSYVGDQGARSLQISATRIIPISNSGDDIFMSIPNANGQFSTRAAAANSGTGVISDGTVSGSYSGDTYSIQFTSPSTYDIVNVSTATTLVSGAAYTSGSTISFAGIDTMVAGAPASGDTFSIAPGGYTDTFNSLKTLIDSLQVADEPAMKQFVAEAINHTDAALDNVLRVRASVGSRINESTALDDVGSATDLQYATTLSRLNDLDYAEAASTLSLRQVALQAAQQAFIKTTGLTLFNYLS